MEQGVVWTSGRGCTVSGGLVGGGFWDAYEQQMKFVVDRQNSFCIHAVVAGFMQHVTRVDAHPAEIHAAEVAIRQPHPVVIRGTGFIDREVGAEGS